MIEVSSRQHDAVIIGGGPVGAAAALELHAAGFDILLVDSRDATAPDDLRPLALSYGSRLILERLGVWEALAPASPIERIHVSQRGRFGRALMSAAEAKLPALGYVVDYRGLVSALNAALSDAGVRTLRGTTVTSAAYDRTSARLELETSDGAAECFAALVVVADGNAEAAGVEAKVIDYGQSAVTARVRVERPQAGTAFERFTDEGPIALLPHA